MIEDVHVAVLLPESLDLVGLECVDEAVGEFVAGHIDPAAVRVVLGQLVAQRVHEVGLAHAAAAMDEDRAVRSPSRGRRSGGRPIPPVRWPGR